MAEAYREMLAPSIIITDYGEQPSTHYSAASNDGDAIAGDRKEPIISPYSLQNANCAQPRFVSAVPKGKSIKEAKA